MMRLRNLLLILTVVMTAWGCASSSPAPQKTAAAAAEPVKKISEPLQPLIPIRGTSYRYYSANHQFYIDFQPAKGATITGPGKGVAHRADNDQVLWEVSWYTKSGILTNDGAHLIRIENEGSDRQQLRDLAIAFYKDGKELQSYAVADLIKDTGKLQRTLNTYFWLARTSAVDTGLSVDAKNYTIALIDGTVYTFSVDTGKILSVDHDPKVRGFE